MVTSLHFHFIRWSGRASLRQHVSSLLVYSTLPTFCQVFFFVFPCSGRRFFFSSLWFCMHVWPFPLLVFAPKIAEHLHPRTGGDYACVKTDDTADKAAAAHEPLHSSPSPCLTSEHACFRLQGDRVHPCVYNLLPCSRSSKVCLEYEMTAEYFTPYF